MTDFLRQHLEELIPLSEEEFTYIRPHFSVLKKRKHQFLIQEKQPVNHIYLVEQGCVKAYHTDPEGKEYILQFAMEHWWVSDFQAFFKRTEATIEVDCIEDATIWALSYDDMEKVCAALPKFEHFFRKKSNMGYVALQARILSLLNKNAQERYDQFATLYPQLLQRIPKQLIAAYLGVSRETLSRFNTR
ncbi:Crp/Fnr family transcriptional regulator [Chitinophaga nivalis]|uniref:Crp/Fnr family transcriptional regulator n=1 Tax=Chitinophaga nivalis TaxID=2991709 RepID=A0ABT3ILZ3_9BACT|nr:Crp/Fnr family transcriptional regulator [Chitinophaga nivalis]MCW3465327.1 Crp/Fnr family transcriptional regulator [Chitinophaga nivalis]MCW3484981.1 Crp/Fnr family transcriptional regulator [Chitinophaga nivalis]